MLNKYEIRGRNQETSLWIESSRKNITKTKTKRIISEWNISSIGAQLKRHFQSKDSLIGRNLLLPVTHARIPHLPREPFGVMWRFSLILRNFRQFHCSYPESRGFPKKNRGKYGENAGSYLPFISGSGDVISGHFRLLHLRYATYGDVISGHFWWRHIRWRHCSSLLFHKFNLSCAYVLLPWF